MYSEKLSTLKNSAAAVAGFAAAAAAAGPAAGPATRVPTAVHVKETFY